MPESAASPQTYSDDQAWLSVSPALAQGGDWAAWLQNGEAQLESLAQQANRVLGTGRGAARAVSLLASGDHFEKGVWRINRHGGLFGGLRADRYRDAYRLQQEVTLSGALRFLGVSTPEVLLAYSKRHGSWWRQHLVTREVPRAQTVFEARVSLPAIQAATALLQQVFDIGLWATDLHPGNVLWQQDCSKCWLIDLAGAELRASPLSKEERHVRVERFVRFFVKHGGSEPAGIAELRQALNK